MSIRRFSSLGRGAHAERQETEAHLPDDAMGLGAARGPPEGRMRVLPRLREHPTPGHRPVLALELVLVVGPASDDVRHRFLPHPPGLVGLDAEALELGSRRRAPGAELDPSPGDEVEHRGRLGRADGMVVGLRREAHAVAEAHALGQGGDGAVEHLGVRAVRVLLEEVVLDGPERVEADLVARAPPARWCSGRPRTRYDRVPRPRHRDLVEHGELHRASSVLADPSTGESPSSTTSMGTSDAPALVAPDRRRVRRVTSL